MDITELLQHRALPTDRPRHVKMLRHKDIRYDVHALAQTGHLETYQKYQAKPLLECPFAVSFLGGKGTRAIFAGAYAVEDRADGDGVPATPAGFPHPELSKLSCYYEMEELPGFDDLKGRVVIDWGNSALSWHQWLDPKRPKEVIEILPSGYVGDFPGFDSVVIDHVSLVALIANPDANRTWHTLLREVAGVYLILDTSSGHQYVGSAYGREGILGRWAQYASSGHGGNQQLRALVENAPGHKSHFQYAILATLPKAASRDDVLAMEALYKRKLGSRAHGLNSN